jgi:IMP dehydrogenase
MVKISDFDISVGFESIAIKQKKNKCNSRLDVKTGSEIIKGIFRPIPLIAANMSTVTSPEFCIKLWEQGALGVMHRALSDSDAIKAIKQIAKKCQVACASVGVGNSQFDFAKELIRAGANAIFIDIAHGYSDAVIEIGRQIKEFSNATKVIVGNTTNTDMVKEVSNFADAIKVGIAQGFACETKDTAGCTEKQFSAVYKFREIARSEGLPVISDGGILKPSDFVKAIGAGANCVMAGKIFAACPESNAELVTVEGNQKKLYAGMASRYVQNRWKGGVKNGTCTEGTIRYLDVGEPCEKLLERYNGALKSGITYAGCTDIEEFKKECEFIRLI